MNSAFAKIFKINKEALAQLPVPLVFMTLKESPPIFFRFVNCDKIHTEAPVEPFYKPISKLICL